MGITIAYRGRMADLARIEDFEDRVLDLGLELGGQAQVWRSFADHDPSRVVRGIILNLAPGQETTSLLLSPEGWLIGLMDLEDAERGRLTEPPWCFTKTQFGSLEGHVALVETLAVLRQEFLPDLEISDEGGYYPERDRAELVRRRALMQQALDSMAEGLQRHGLHPEAAEDPDILCRRIERIAAQVHQILQRPPEHPPVEFPEEFSDCASDPETVETLWDEMFKHKRRQQEWMARSLEEQRSCGEDDEASFAKALNDLGLDLPGEKEPLEDDGWHEEEQEPFLETTDDFSPLDTDATAAGDNPFSEEEADRHPLLERAMDLLKDLHLRFRDADKQLTSALRMLFQGAGDAMGGLAQALSPNTLDDPDDYGLRVVQLKRALRGAAFACGSLFLLRSAVSADEWNTLHDRLSELKQDIFQELARTRSEYRGEDMEA